MTDKERYEKLKDFIIDLSPYCDTCANRETGSRCDNCHRKMFSWRFDEKVLERFE